MCGIAGIVAPLGFDPQTLVRMTNLVHYRGPDGFGFAYTRPGRDEAVEVIYDQNRTPSQLRPVIGLGNRRLAILDVSALGSQPMQTDDGEYCITFNGEIYNYKEIRQELEGRNYRFRTGTDTEVVLRAYQEWGEDCLQRFNGMWSFALWDRPRQRLFCSRDRFGVKPFYFAFADGAFYFGSEIKQVLEGARMPRVANSPLVFNFLEWGLIDNSEETFFEGVRQLPGGYWLMLHLSDTLSPVIRRYWELRIEPTSKVDESKAVEEFRALFENAVRLRLRSDVPVGFSLSGGLDSSAIVCEAQKIVPNAKFQTFSACFVEEAYDEREYISEILTATGGTGHWTFPDGSTFWKTIQRILFHQDEPLGSGGVFAQWCVMAEAREHGTPVILGGQGGDEALCGYQKYCYFYLWHLLRHFDPKFFRESVLWTRNHTRSFWDLADANRYFPTMIRRSFSPTERLCTSDFRNESSQLRSGLGVSASIAERQKADLTRVSLPAMLHSEDRNSMAHSVESRLPFLDYKLVEFVVNCPPSVKMRDGWSKWVLRHSLAGTLPDKIRLRKTKLGFNTPEGKWVREGLRNGHRDIWAAPRLRMARFLDAAKLARESQKLLNNAVAAVAPNWLLRSMELELWAHVHSVS
jgi:asparagine synthase (glutamine-hydrolysing)